MRVLLAVALLAAVASSALAENETAPEEAVGPRAWWSEPAIVAGIVLGAAVVVALVVALAGRG